MTTEQLTATPQTAAPYRALNAHFEPDGIRINPFDDQAPILKPINDEASTFATGMREMLRGICYRGMHGDTRVNNLECEIETEGGLTIKVSHPGRNRSVVFQATSFADKYEASVSFNEGQTSRGYALPSKSGSTKDLSQRLADKAIDHLVR